MMSDVTTAPTGHQNFRPELAGTIKGHNPRRPACRSPCPDGREQPCRPRADNGDVGRLRNAGSVFRIRRNLVVEGITHRLVHCRLVFVFSPHALPEKPWSLAILIAASGILGHPLTRCHIRPLRQMFTSRHRATEPHENNIGTSTRLSMLVGKLIVAPPEESPIASPSRRGRPQAG